MPSKTMYEENLRLLELFQRRRPFHDHAIESIRALNKRVIIQLDEWSLVILGVTEAHLCEAPTCWDTGSFKPLTGGRFRLDVETDEGPFYAVGTDIRLIRNSDLTMLIPPVDPP